jgi:hypothetical protein
LKITNEIKAKVFGQYLSYYADQPTRLAVLSVIEKLLDGSRSAEKMSSHRIELKPLCEITDQDFKEAAKLLPEGFRTDKDFVVHRVHNIQHIVFANVNGLKIFKIFTGDGIIMLDDTVASPCYTHHAHLIYQFLQSRGYDLPNYHLGGKTLEQAGLAYYEEGKQKQKTQEEQKHNDKQYSANFLWGFEDNSIEALGYEFANAKTEEYQKECWKALVEKIKSTK